MGNNYFTYAGTRNYTFNPNLATQSTAMAHHATYGQMHKLVVYVNAQLAGKNWNMQALQRAYEQGKPAAATWEYRAVT